MGVLPFAVVFSTVALTTALPKVPGGTLRQQQVSDYFPDFRYPDQMVNPSFMTAKCESEGVFPHPYNCTWFYRCHDRLGRGFFFTSYFICEPGTEFDDDLDQCIPKSGTCGDDRDIHFCRTLDSSCRYCPGSQEKLCEFKECYSGGRDAGIQRMCKEGQLHNGQTCVDVSNCPWSFSPPGECPLNKLRPTAKWIDETSSCSEYTGCRAGKNYQETLCNSYYDCPEGAKVERFCPEGYLFSKQWKLCIQPPQESADCVIPPPPPPPPKCYPHQGLGDTCQQYSGCQDGQTLEITQTLCDYYRCPSTGASKFRCEGADQVFNPNTKTCQNRLSSCPIVECFPEKAVRWESCVIKSGCRFPNTERLSEQLCQEYSCSDRNNLRPCGPGKLFNVSSKTCVADLTPCPIPVPCTASNAQSWGQCDTVSGCNQFGQEISMELCQHFKCSSLREEYRCQNGQVFSPTRRVCVDPIEACPCTEARAIFWSNCIDVNGCIAVDQNVNQTQIPVTAFVIPQRSQVVQVKQCQQYSCSNNGPEYSCEAGQVFNPDTKACGRPISVSNCPCTVDRAQRWTGCNDVTGCTANNQYTRTEKQCQYFSCSSTGIEVSCKDGQVYSPSQRSCVEPLNAASCPCTENRAQFWGDCKDVTGCSSNNRIERTEKQCNYYSCSFTGSDISCPGGQIFNPDQRACVEPLNAGSCPCTVDRAQFWGDCIDVTGCSANNQIKRTEKQCNYYSCSLSGSDISCPGGQVFNPDQRACVEPLNAASCPCTINRAQFWGDCVDVTGCSSNNKIERTEKQCNYYSCSVTGSDISCPSGQVFSPDQRACVEPLNAASCPCTVNRAQFWGDCIDVTGCSSNNRIERTEKQCIYYSCSVTGSDISCPSTQVFSPDQRACVEPLDATSCPCTVNRAQFWGDCVDFTGCSSNTRIEQTEKQCNYYSCSRTGLDISCPSGQVFSPDQRACVEPLNVCPTPPTPPTPKKCTPPDAKRWTKCTTYCDAGEAVELCYGYYCDEDRNAETEMTLCNKGELLFNPQLYRCVTKQKKSCIRSAGGTKTGPGGLRVNCTPKNANWWNNCSITNACVADRYPQQQQNLCENYSCEENGTEFLCNNGQKFDVEKAECVAPLTELQC